MVRVTSAEFQRQIGRYQDTAIGGEPVLITSRGRPRVVMISAEDYDQLRRASRRVMRLEDFTDDDIAALEAVVIRPEMSRYDHEVEE